MTLKRRLGSLEAAAIARWRADWERYVIAVEEAMSPAVRRRVDTVLAIYRNDPEEAARRWADREIADVLADVDLQGLDLTALDEWFSGVAPPDPDHPPDLSFTPRSIPLAPLEPLGAWEALEALLSDEGERGDAAAVALLCLAVARATREN